MALSTTLRDVLLTAEGAEGMVVVLAVVKRGRCGKGEDV